MTDEAEEVEKEDEKNDYIDVQSMKNSSDYDAAGNWEAGYGQ